MEGAADLKEPPPRPYTISAVVFKDFLDWKLLY